MGRPKNGQPAYLLFKPKGLARVRIDGRMYYLGQYGSPESWQKYYQLLADKCGTVAPAIQVKASGCRLTVGELAKAFMAHCKEYYGPKASQVYCVRSALRPLDRGNWGNLPVDQFTPLKLQQVIEQRVLDGDCRDNETTKTGPLSRSTVNSTLRLIKQMFSWGVSQELVPNETYAALTTVKGIRKGKGRLADKMREPGKVRPAPEKDIEATLAELKKSGGHEVAAMIQIQLLTGMRPDEVTTMRPGDLDQDGKVWVYRPEQHKNEWRGDEHEIKEVLIGPRAQKILRPFIDGCESVSDYLFSPIRVQSRAKEVGESQVLKLWQYHPPRPCYDDASYRQAVRRACRRAKVSVWTPNQLRHNAATNLREKFGIENSQLPLGHKHTKTNEIYAEKNRKQYEKMMIAAG